MIHTCHAIDCIKPIHPTLFMCLKHWRLVPLELKRHIWQYYRPGQEVDKNPSREYLETARLAINAVAAEERKTPLPDINDDPVPTVRQLFLL